MIDRGPRGVLRPPLLDAVGWARLAWAAGAWTVTSSGGAFVSITDGGGGVCTIRLDDSLGDVMDEVIVLPYVSVTGGATPTITARTARGTSPPAVTFNLNTLAAALELDVVIYAPRVPRG